MGTPRAGVVADGAPSAGREQDDPLEFADVLSRQEGRIVHAKEATHGRRAGRTGRAKDVGGLSTFEAGVERDEHGPAEARRGRRASIRHSSAPTWPPVAGTTPAATKARA